MSIHNDLFPPVELTDIIALIELARPLTYLKKEKVDVHVSFSQSLLQYLVKYSFVS